MNARYSHVTRRAPDWSRRHHLFRHLDGSDADWRSVTLDQGEPSNWAEIYAFFSGSAVTLLGVFILLLVFGIRP